MAFPFWWIGALTAGVFLAAVFALFGVALRLLTATTNGIRGSVLPGLVSGFRDWADTPGVARSASRNAGTARRTASDMGIEELAAPTATARVRRR